MSGPRYWISVAQKSHVMDGVDKNAALFRQGSGSDAHEMRPGDWFVFYSPAETIAHDDEVQAFTAMGTIEEGDAEKVVDDKDRWEALKRPARYRSTRRADIHALTDDLTFIENRSAWGSYFRRSIFEISKADLLTIAHAMDVDTAEIQGD